MIAKCLLIIIAKMTFPIHIKVIRVPVYAISFICVHHVIWRIQPFALVCSLKKQMGQSILEKYVIFILKNFYLHALSITSLTE